MRLIFVALLLSLFVGCGDGNASSFAVDFITLGDTHQPLPGVTVKVDGKAVATSDVRGLVQTQLNGDGALSAAITYDCPKGFKPAEEKKTLVLRSFERAGAANDGVLRMRLRCLADQRVLAIVVDAQKKADLPIEVNGQKVTSTNLDGFAFHTVTATNGSNVKVEVVIPTEVRLRPNNPPGVFEVGDEDRIVTYLQLFDTLAPLPSTSAQDTSTITKPVVKKTQKKKRRSTIRRAPRRISGPESLPPIRRIQ
ncbi:MAG: hypothetical protein R3A47_00115 [Polyangiales bacterium]